MALAALESDERHVREAGRDSRDLMPKAEHARRLADLLSGDPAAERLHKYADDLDALAATMDDDKNS
jgi:hypothetical protein